MSREIDQTKPLSAEDREYLLQRGHEQTVQYLDQLHDSRASEEEQRELDTPGNEGPAMPEFQDPSLASQTALHAEDVEPDADDADDADAEGDRYDEMNKPALKAEAERRELPVGGTAEELRERLRAHDAEQA